MMDAVHRYEGYVTQALGDGIFALFGAYLATGIEGVASEDLGKLRSIISMWSVRAARQTAWSNAQLLWHFRHNALSRDPFLLGIDRMTDYAGRGLLLPIA